MRSLWRLGASSRLLFARPKVRGAEEDEGSNHGSSIIIPAAALYRYTSCYNEAVICNLYTSSCYNEAVICIRLCIYNEAVIRIRFHPDFAYINYGFIMYTQVRIIQNYGFIMYTGLCMYE